ncbi:MAG: asparagine synthase (glutamine-hydrolyzing) [Pyrinomonadaceae bacterium]|nr:asparagine synthase (glutamine-hydrolyzing) [Acidobacteriota bacterium]MBK7932728.1 asparagine synthase (glutamine-hydrolyzing) [Acidobacteriota bacterium]MBP7374943.1 asparagine synthase (glutamine-hydrolyzing) [Pyrinomonadaceae bacterium]
MCGIAGIVGLKDKSEAAAKIHRMTDLVSHRGPDAEGFFVDDGIALGHRRLSIIDLSEEANHPLFDASGRYAIILNGEIYNFRDVKATLPEYEFHTAGDTEIVLAAFLKHGPECLSMLNGMFAIVIWDNVDKTLFVARDRLGVKPLYYSMTSSGVFVFSSEIRSILGSGLVDKTINSFGLFEYLMYQSVYAPQTIIEGIHQLGAGEYACIKDGKITSAPFWQIEKTSADVAGDIETVRKDVRELLLRSVERRMISDVPLGAFLSGGIDSSAVVALMSEVSTQPVNTFSVTFDEKEYDESPYSKIIAAKYKTHHASVRLTSNDFLAALPDALRAIDSPSGDGLNTYVVSKATRESGITVALSGLGGDELFAGYHYFDQWLRTRTGVTSRVPHFVRKLASGLLANSSNSKYQRIADLLSVDRMDISTVYPKMRQVLSQRLAGEYYGNGSHDILIEKILAERLADIEGFPMISQFTIAELLGYTQNVLLKDTDQFAMASALEVREPFFDYHLVEYVLRIPDSMKLSATPKGLLVDSLGDMLPREIVDRPKMGFVLPFEKWMRGELLEFCSSRIDLMAQRGILDADRLRSKWQLFLDGRVRWSELWHIIVLTEWLENNNI